MALYTEPTLRRLVRQLLMEAAGTAESVAITNGTRSKIRVQDVFAESDEGEIDLLPAIEDEAERDIGPGETLTVSFTPADESTSFVFRFDSFGGTGVTPRYSRKKLTVKYQLGAGSIDVIAPTAGEGEDVGDAAQMTDDQIAALAKPGEMHKVVDDPTDPDFAYAVFYVASPTRAVVVRAPEGDRKGKNIVSSKGQEISLRRYGSSFQKIGAELKKQLEVEFPGGADEADAE